jgi:hypothetical protein
MLIRYKLTNVPDGGVGHILPGRGMTLIDEQLTDELVDEMIQLGITRYFIPIDDGKETRATANSGRQRDTTDRFAKRADTPGTSDGTDGGTDQSTGAGADSEAQTGE